MEFTERNLDQYVQWFERAGGRKGRPGNVRTAAQYVRCVLDYAEASGWVLDVDDAEAFILAAGSPNQLRMRYRGLRAFAKWRAERLEADDPFARLSKRLGGAPEDPVPSDDRTTVATTADVEALLETCNRSRLGRRDAALIAVLSSSGIRAGECAELRRDDVSFAERTILLRDPKNHEPRRTILSDEAVLLLERYLLIRPEVPNGWLWHAAQRCRPQEHLEASGVSQMVTRRARQAGVKVSAHSLRRGFAVRWLDAGGSETYLKVVCGWKHPEMVRRYTKAVQSVKAVEFGHRLFDGEAA